MSSYPHYQPHSSYRSLTGRQLPPAPSRRTASQAASSHSNNRLVWRVALVALVGVAFLAHFGWNKHVSAAAAATKHAQQRELAAANQKAAVFKQQLSALQAANPQLDLSVAVADGTIGLQQFGGTDAYNAASIGKLITASAYLHQVDAKKLSLDAHIDGKTARYWLSIMLTKSDDEAWEHLNTYLTHEQLTAYASSIGLTNYDVETDRFPAGDAARLLQKLQTGALLSQPSQQLLLAWMAKANYRAYIVPAVPSGTAVFHKVGFDGDNLHDAAILSRGGKSLSLVIFTNGHGTYNWDGRAELMQTITRDAVAAYL